MRLHPGFTIFAFSTGSRASITITANAIATTTVSGICHGRRSPDTFLLAQQHFIKFTQTGRQFRIEHCNLFIHGLLPCLVNRGRSKQARWLRRTSQVRRHRQPGLGQCHAVLGNQAVQTSDIGGVVSRFRSIEATALPLLMKILLGSNHGRVTDAQALEQLSAAGYCLTGYQQGCNYR
jgi:hypothetical protein